MRKVKYYKCPECGKKFRTLGGWATHVNTLHPDARPEGYSDLRFFYYTLTGKTAGKCIECGSPTDWNEATGKYNRFCNNPNCKKAYVKVAKSRMINKYGKAYLLNDPEMQRKMLLSKKISGYYEFSDGSGKLGYVGSYEKDFLTMMDKFMGYSATDIMSPSPHTYYYDYDGGKHFYIPDYYIPNLNLEIEIKAQDNTHPKIQAVDKVKEKLKDEVMMNNPTINYLKINDKSYRGFFEFMLNLKDSIDESTLIGNGKNLPELSKASEGIEYTPEIEEVGYSYDPIIHAVMEGAVFEPWPYAPASAHQPIVFIFRTTATKPRHVGFVTGDIFSNVIIAFPDIHEDKTYAIVPEYEGDVEPRTLVAYAKSLLANEIDMGIGSTGSDNDEYMMFEARIPFGLSTIDSILKDLAVNLTPILYNWDKCVTDWISHSDGYHYFCYRLLHEIIDTIRPSRDIDGYLVKVLNDMGPESFVLIDRGLTCELTPQRIRDAVYSIAEDGSMVHKRTFIEETVRENTDYYDELPPTLEMLYFTQAFSDAKENYVFSTEDYKQNLDKWKPGKNNILFVTGHSGSGKTTLAENIEKEKKAIMFELDGIEFNYDASGKMKILSKVKQNVPEYAKYIKTGKFEYESLNEDESKIHILQAALLEAIKICQADSSNIYVFEGIQLFEWLDPKWFENKPLIIKGTSMIKSYFRAVKRSGIKNTMSLSSFATAEKYLKTFEDDLPAPKEASESIQLHTNFSKVRIRGTKDLSKYRRIVLTQDVLDKYKEKCASFGHCRISNMSKGYVWVDKSDNIVGFVNVVRKEDNIKWIQALNIQPNYQGYGLYEQLLKVAVRELGGTDIETPPKNDTAREVYEKFGFKTYTNEESRRCMSIRADAARAKYNKKAKANAVNMVEAGLYPIYVILTDGDTEEGFVKVMDKSPYSEVSISFDSSMTEVYSFGSKDGHRMLPVNTSKKNLMLQLKSDPDARYAIYTKLISKKDYDSAKSKVNEIASSQEGFHYDAPSAVKSASDSSDVNDKRYFCAGIAAYILGTEVKSGDDVQDIKNIHLVDMGLVRDYNKSYIDKKVNAIYEKEYMHKEKDEDKQPIED